MKLIARVPRSNILLLNFSLFNIRSASTESESLSKDSTEPRHSGDSQSDGQLSLDVADNNRYSTIQYSTVQLTKQQYTLGKLGTLVTCLSQLSLCVNIKRRLLNTSVIFLEFVLHQSVKSKGGEYLLRTFYSTFS